jgi:hypothetical protein
MRKRLADLNPQASMRMANRLIGSIGSRLLDARPRHACGAAKRSCTQSKINSKALQPNDL